MEPEESRKGLALKPEALAAAGLGLSVVLVLLLSARLRTLQRENEVLRQNYRGAVDVVNHRVPCPCQQNGNAGHVTTTQPVVTQAQAPGSVQLPADLPVEEGRS